MVVPRDATLERAFSLSDEALKLTSNIDLPRGDLWPTTVTVFLAQSNDRLGSIQILLENQLSDSIVILARSHFELTTNLSYINEDVSGRLDEYLRHGGIPTTQDEMKKLRDELDRNDYGDAAHILPRTAWVTLKNMCTELGSDWLAEYKTFYRYASIPTHAGSFTLGHSLQTLLSGQTTI